MRHIAISEDHLIDALTADQLFHLVLGINGNTLGVLDTTQNGRVPPVGDPGDLGSSEGNDLILGIVTKIRIEGMKVPSSRAHDEYALDWHAMLSFRCRDAGALTLNWVRAFMLRDSP
jgi:hypothetical protein